MANLIDPTELMFTAFEPKVTNRFVFYVDGIPSYLIRKAARPKLVNNETEIKHINNSRFIKGRSNWDAITVELYDPIVPSGAQAVMEWARLHHESVTGRNGYADFYKKDVDIYMLGPVGDKIENWKLKGAFIQSANFGSLEWASATDVAEITLTLSYDYAILEY